METLSPKELEVLQYIEREVDHWNYPPSVREICRSLGISSTATAHGIMTSLEEKGYISRVPAKPRAIKLLRGSSGRPETRCVFAPLVGTITAGRPILAEENLEGYFPVPVELYGGDDCFVLQVVGDSMTGAGIHDKDYVIVRKQESAENGDVVAALLGEEATVKRFFRENGTFRLQPENDSYEPIRTPEAVILGKVIGLYRRL